MSLPPATEQCVWKCCAPIVNKHVYHLPTEDVQHLRAECMYAMHSPAGPSHRKNNEKKITHEQKKKHFEDFQVERLKVPVHIFDLKKIGDYMYYSENVSAAMTIGLLKYRLS